MHMSFSHIADAEATADLVAPLHLVSPGPSDDQPRDRQAYGAAGRPNWFAIAAIAALHALLIAMLSIFGVIALPKAKPEPTLVTLIPDPVVPTAPPPPPSSAKPVAAPSAAPSVMAETVETTTAPVSAAVPVSVPTPAPAPAPVVAAVSAVPAPAPPAPPAPIIPPDIGAALVGNPAPTYPMESRRRHEQGLVRLRVLVSVDGRVKDISVASSSGFDRLDRAALEAVRRWHFKAGSQGGVPIETVGYVPIPFRLT